MGKPGNEGMPENEVNAKGKPGNEANAKGKPGNEANGDIPC